MLKSFRRLFVIYRGYRLKLLFSQVLLAISALASIGVATLSQRLINDGLMAQNEDVILSSGVWMAVLALVAGATMAGTAAYAVFFAEGTAYILRTELYRKIQSFSFANFDQFRTGNLLVRLNADVNNVNQAVLFSVMLLLYAPFMVIVAFIMAWLRTPGLVWVLVVVAAIVLAVTGLIVPRIFRAYDERQRCLDAINNTMQENLSGVRVVKAFTREKLETERFEQRASAMRTPSFQAVFQVALLTPIINSIAQLSSIVTVWLGGSKCWQIPASILAN